MGKTKLDKIKAFQNNLIYFRYFKNTKGLVKQIIGVYRNLLFNGIESTTYVEDRDLLDEAVLKQAIDELLEAPVNKVKELVERGKPALMTSLDVIESARIEGETFNFYNTTTEEQLDYIKQFMKDTGARPVLRPYPALKIPIPTITLVDGEISGEFPDLWLYIMPQLFPKVVVDGPKTRGYVHPHVSRGRAITHRSVCLGESEAAVITAIARADLYSIFDLLTAVLSTYNAKSPFIRLSAMLGYTNCPNCGVGIHRTDMIVCIGCGYSVCPGCIAGHVEQHSWCERCAPTVETWPQCNICHRPHRRLSKCILCSQDICSECSLYAEPGLFERDDAIVCTGCTEQYEELLKRYRNQ